jgi:hypothetical protein
LVTGAAKAGLEELPVFSKKIVLPKVSPIRASRSPSPSMSTKFGLLRVPTSVIARAGAGSRLEIPTRAQTASRRVAVRLILSRVRREAPRTRRSRRRVRPASRTTSAASSGFETAVPSSTRKQDVFMKSPL